MDKRMQLFNFIEEKFNHMIELQNILTSIPAIGPENGGEGEFKKAQELLKWLREQGFLNIETFDAPDDRVPSAKRPNIVVTIPGKSEERVFWIMTHLDIVPPGEKSLWDTEPYTTVVKDGKIYGRGTEDNQQGMVASIFAALAFLKEGITPAPTVKLLFVSDEETGSNYGIKYILNNYSIFGKNDKFLVPDGGFPDGSMIEIAEKSILWLKFNTHGKQCHAARPELGINAFVAGSEIVTRFAKLYEKFGISNSLFTPPYSTFTPTRKEENVPNINTIPGEDVFYMDCRVLPSIKVDDVLKEIDRITEEIEKKQGVKVERKTVQKVESLPTPRDSPLVKALENAIKEVYQIEAKPIGVGGGTVGAYLRNEGFHTVVWSKIDDTAHMPNEYCVIENMIGDSKVMALMMLG